MSTPTGKEAPAGKQPSAALVDLAKQALAVATMARKHGKSLAGAHRYASKLASLRTEATVALKALSGGGRDTTALKPLVEACFAAKTEAKARLEAKRELEHLLVTEWSGTAPAAMPGEEDAIFPLEMLKKRPYLKSIGRQANGCFGQEWYDACGVMMRRLLEIAIIEAFEAKGTEAKIKDSRGEYVQLTDLAKATLAERWPLSRNTKPLLLDLVKAGHRTAHGRLMTYRKYITEVRQGFRDAVEDLLRVADLL